MKAARTFAAGPPSRWRSALLQSAKVAFSTMERLRQATDVLAGRPSDTVGVRSLASCVSGARSSGAPSKTNRSPAYTMRSTMERSRSWPPAPTIIQPRPCNQHRSWRVRRNRSISAPSWTRTKACRPSDPFSASPVSLRTMPELVDRRSTLATCSRSGATDTTADQNPPRVLTRPATAAGIPLVS